MRKCRSIPITLALFLSGWMLSCTTTKRASKGDQASETLSQVQTEKLKNQVKIDNVGFYMNPESKTYYTDKVSKFSLKSQKSSKFSRIEVSVDNQSFRTYTKPLTFDEQGAHIVRYRTLDALGNQSPTKTVKVIVDTTPPDIDLFWDGLHVKKNAKTVIHSSTKLNLSANDSLSGVAKTFIKLSPSESPKEYKEPILFKSDGLKEVWVSAADNVGNLSKWRKYRFTVDRSAPEVKITVKGSNKKEKQTLYTANQTKLSIVANDQNTDIAQIQYRINDGPIQIFQGEFIAPKTSAQIEFRALDQVGNISRWQRVTTTPDFTPPSIMVSKLSTAIEQNGIIYAKPGFSLKVRGTDSDSGLKSLKISKGTGEYTELSKNSISFDKPGVHHITFLAEDSVGNLHETAVQTVFIDNTVEASKVRTKRNMIEKDGIYFTNLPNTIEVVGQDNGVGVAHVEVSYDGKVFHRINEALDLARWTDKRKTVYYRAIDKLGNMEKPQKMTVQIEEEAPQVEIFINTKNSQQKPLSQAVEQ